MSKARFTAVLYDNDIVWAPDGDEAFDDGSFVLHFDCGPRVRLIGFKSCGGGQDMLDTLADVWLPENYFYTVLQRWHDEFNYALSALKVR